MARENPSILRKRAARIAAVQGIYQSLVLEEPIRAASRAERITEQWQNETQKDEPEWHANAVPEKSLLSMILEGVEAHHASLDQHIEGSLQEGWKLSRIAHITHALLRAAVFELMYHEKLNEGIIVNEYVSMAAEFIDAKDVDYVHACLRTLAHHVRDGQPLPEKKSALQGEASLENSVQEPAVEVVKKSELASNTAREADENTLTLGVKESASDE